jgi:hypothetical protein
VQGSTRPTIGFHRGGKINENAFKALVRAAVILNRSRAKH